MLIPKTISTPSLVVEKIVYNIVDVITITKTEGINRKPRIFFLYLNRFAAIMNGTKTNIRNDAANTMIKFLIPSYKKIM